VLAQRASDACSVIIWKEMRATGTHRMEPDMAIGASTTPSPGGG